MGNTPSAFRNFSGMVETSDSITDGSGEFGYASLITVTTRGWRHHTYLEKFNSDSTGFGGLKGLESLDLSHNNLSGAIQKTLENLKELTKLDISNNELIGQIPVVGQMGTLNDADSYANNNGDLRGLKSINISHNDLDGEIPLIFGGLKSLESLDLSHNSLSGVISRTLESAQELAILDLSNNKLVSQIPIGGQMGALNDANFYANNSGLYGIQIQVSCEKNEGGNEEIIKEEDDQWFLWQDAWIGYIIGFFWTVLVISLIGFFSQKARQRPPLVKLVWFFKKIF
ncbi:hypothetical protein GIB67_023457 [Kingdonia uniflora]|uniref:Uncharacterized protein n=1 Tax=Kingdonia uniflora TaxID=39325 RepID=A0A7J7P9T1_9MAGN|nr:hypothetical protein GIB67_023457 [Kingdonia uniflora]